MLTDFVSGNSNTYTKNPIYWDKEKIGGSEYKLPFVDKITYRTIKDEATFITALRTGKLDMLETIRWQNVDELKKSAPQLKWSRWLNHVGHLHGDARRRRSRSTTSACAARSTWRSTSRRSSRPTTTATPSCSPIRSTPTTSATSSRWKHAGLGQGAVQVRPGQGQEAAGRGGLPQGLHLQGAGLLLQSRPHGPAAAGRRPISSRSASSSRSSRMEYGAFLSAMTSQDHAPATS